MTSAGRCTFGVPMFFIDPDMYFGKGRLHDAKEALAVEPGLNP